MKRILLKLSGEALAGEKKTGFDEGTVRKVALQIKQLVEEGVQVGVVIGGAFGKITSSLVDNIIMPPLSLLFGKVDFSGLFISLNGQHYDTLKAAQDAHAPILAYGLFINTIVNFLIIAFAIFVLIKQINRLTPPPAPAPEPRLCPFCKTAIADDATRCPHCTSQL